MAKKCVAVNEIDINCFSSSKKVYEYIFPGIQTFPGCLKYLPFHGRKEVGGYIYDDRVKFIIGSKRSVGWPEVETIPKMSFHTHPEAEKLTPSYADILVLLLSPSSVSIISNNKDYYVMSREENCLSMYIDINRELDSSARGKKFSEKKRIIYGLNEIYDRRTGRKSLYGFDNRSFYKDIKKTLLGYGISVVEYIKNESGDIVLVVQGSGAGGQGAGRP